MAVELAELDSQRQSLHFERPPRSSYLHSRTEVEAGVGSYRTGPASVRVACGTS